MPAGDVRAEFDAMLRRKAEQAQAAGDPGDLGEPEVLTVARLPTERERVGAELVAYRDHDGGEPEWHVDLIDRDTAETLLSLTVGQAIMIRAQMGIAVREALSKGGTGGQLAPVGPAYRPRELVGPDHPLHDEGDEDPPGVSWCAP